MEEFTTIHVFHDQVKLVAILPNVKQAYDVLVLEQAHDSDLALQAIRYRLDTRSHRRIVVPAALNKVPQTLSTRALCHGPRDDLDSAILSCVLVTDRSDTRAATLSDGLAKLPVADVGLPFASRGSGRGGGDGRVSLGIILILGGDLGQSSVLRRVMLTAADGEGAICHERLVVRQRIGRVGRGLQALLLHTVYRWRVGPVRELGKRLALAGDSAGAVSLSHGELEVVEDACVLMRAREEMWVVT